MGMLIDGVWTPDRPWTRTERGDFVRAQSAFRDWVRADGSSGWPAEAGRYHLFVSYACPWAHRTLIYRCLKGLESAISVSVVAPLMLRDGWTFGGASDPASGHRFLHEVYSEAAPSYSGRVTVPVLWDRKTRRIVSNESSEIIRMMDWEMGPMGASGPVLCPPDLRARIDTLNTTIYDTVNNGVYRCGFAQTQAAYEEAFAALFETLDGLDALLLGQRYLVGDRITEADWRLFTSLVRFDTVYVGHFKCNARRIADYPALSAYLRELYQMPGIRETVHMDHIKTHYYGSHLSINPTGIVPVGPVLDLDAPHGRETLAAAAPLPSPSAFG